jgi:hypothetical protein
VRETAAEPEISFPPALLLTRLARSRRYLIGLNLANNQVGDKGGRGLLKGMATNTRIRSLVLGGNKMGATVKEALEGKVKAVWEATTAPESAGNELVVRALRAWAKVPKAQGSGKVQVSRARERSSVPWD